MLVITGRVIHKLQPAMDFPTGPRFFWGSKKSHSAAQISPLHLDEDLQLCLLTKEVDNSSVLWGYHAAWWLIYPSEVSWDYEIPNIWNNKIHVPNHQPAWECSGIYTSIYPYLSNEISTIVMGFWNQRHFLGDSDVRGIWFNEIWTTIYAKNCSSSSLKKNISKAMNSWSFHTC